MKQAFILILLCSSFAIAQEGYHGVSSGGSGTPTDTTSLSNRINQSIAKSDTAIYSDTKAKRDSAITANRIDTTSLSNRINQSIAKADTATYSDTKTKRDSAITAQAVKLNLKAGYYLVYTPTTDSMRFLVLKDSTFVKHIFHGDTLTYYFSGVFKDSTNIFHKVTGDTIAIGSSASGGAMTATQARDTVESNRKNFGNSIWTVPPFLKGYQNFAYAWDDFISGAVNNTATGGLPWATTIVSSASQQNGASDTNSFGILQLATNTTSATASISLTAGSSNVSLGNGVITVSMRARIANLTATGNNFIVRCGLLDVAGIGLPVDGIYFQADSTDTHWQYATSANSVLSIAASTVTINANQWYKLRFDVNAYTVHYYIDDVLIATVNSASVPNGSARATGPELTIAKTSGLTSRTVDFDWYYIEKVFTVAR